MPFAFWLRNEWMHFLLCPQSKNTQKNTQSLWEEQDIPSSIVRGSATLQAGPAERAQQTVTLMTLVHQGKKMTVSVTASYCQYVKGKGIRGTGVKG